MKQNILLILLYFKIWIDFKTCFKLTQSIMYSSTKIVHFSVYFTILCLFDWLYCQMPHKKLLFKKLNNKLLLCVNQTVRNLESLSPDQWTTTSQESQEFEIDETKYSVGYWSLRINQNINMCNQRHRYMFISMSNDNLLAL